MSITIKAARRLGADYERMAAVIAAVEGDGYLSGADLADEDEDHLREGRFSRSWLAEAADQTVGYAGVSHADWTCDDAFYFMRLRVAPGSEGMGIGRRLLETLLGTLSERQAREVMANVDVRRPRAMRFAQHAGFTEKSREAVSTLDLKTFDRSRADRFVERAREHHVAILTLDEFRQTDRLWFDRLFAIFTVLEVQVPASFAVIASTATSFHRQIVESPTTASRFTRVAVVDGRPVGFTELRYRRAEPSSLAQGFTGVVEELRRRGIATGLKASALAAAAGEGFATVATRNDVRNTAMLGVNALLGFVPSHEEAQVSRTLT